MLRQPTSESAFRAALAWLLSIEGGYANHPLDRGGPTYAGISQRAVVGLKDTNGQLEFDLDADGDVDAQDIALLAERPDMVEEFYRERYWRAAGCPLLTWPASLLTFDCAAHSGARVGVVTLQRAARVTADGKVGPETAMAVARMDAAELASRFLAIRVGLFRDIVARRADQAVFFDGWVARQFRLLVEALVVRPK